MKAHLPWLLVLLAMTVRAAPLATIELRPHVEVTRPVVTLGEVARLESKDLSVMRALVDLPLGPAPAAGRTATLQRVALAAWIRVRAGIPEEALQWVGPAAGELVAATRLLRGEDIAAAAEVALREWLQAQGVRGELQHDGLPGDLDMLAGDVALRPRSLQHLGLRPRMVVWVEVWSGENFVRAVPVPFHVQAWRTVPRTAAALPAGAPLLEAVLVNQDVDVAAATTPPLADVPAGLRVRHALRPGETLNAANTEIRPLVQRGQWAALRSGAGLVTSEARVEVLQDGRLGDSVRVRQPGASGGVIARVTGPGLLEIAR
ncbi:flagella basal body P-ring formation protein FlgA [Ramlibacter sp. G-1-2-2]|uniref:Flagella basal body P-ring formation protein FlgA n=1 Tax=Ramlibacter agri TaxID=2728837 RepID=A0A848GXN7_9BURK|nr:flagella basal body P-ring formation protein FlgA [Ramlibacter agri]NML42917.1 flagella basal body P-ring formation protein FlgA [Ramlibacter agri]